MSRANFQHILDSLPEKLPRSRLQPYRALIEKLRRQGRTYREIVGILSEKCNLQVSLSTLHDFVSVQSRELPKRQSRAGVVAVNALNRPATDRSTNPVSATPDDVQARILALKHRCATQPQPPEKLFHYDPDEPLHLPQDIRKPGSDG